MKKRTRKKWRENMRRMRNKEGGVEDENAKGERG